MLTQRQGRRLPAPMFLRGAVALALLAGVALACQPAPSPTGAGRPAAPPQTTAAGAGLQEWERLLEAAKREGVVSVYGAGPDNRTMAEAFGQAFPDIKVEGTYAPTAQLLSRITSERTANRHLADIYFGLGGSAVIQLKPLGALAPMQAELVLPDVVELSAWQDGRLWWVDAEEPHTTLAFVGRVQEVLSYNSSVVDANAISSLRDLLDPRWRGRIVAADFRQPGPGATFAAYAYKQPELGRTYLERLLTETELTLSSDPRQMVDWVVQGRFPIGLAISRPVLLQAIDQGLPLRILPGDQFREPAPMTAGGGTISIADQAPHPNAAKLFLNWLLSKEGQATWQQLIRENSLRIDIEKTDIPLFNIPTRGRTYVSTSTEEYARLGASQELADLIAQTLERIQR